MIADCGLFFSSFFWVLVMYVCIVNIIFNLVTLNGHHVTIQAFSFKAT